VIGIGGSPLELAEDFLGRGFVGAVRRAHATLAVFPDEAVPDFPASKGL
jgi:hypothetical protein